MNSKLEFLYLEVGAYRKEVTGRSGIVEKWMYVLKNLSRLEGRPPELRERVFERLFEAARIAAYTREERNQYESDMMNENDYRNTIEYAREEGLAAGLAEGEAKGREAGLAEGEAKGRHEIAMQIAKRLLASGIPEELITEFTGLSAEQLAELK